jgi:hypothetical protein
MYHLLPSYSASCKSMSDWSVWTDISCDPGSTLSPHVYIIVGVSDDQNHQNKHSSTVRICWYHRHSNVIYHSRSSLEANDPTLAVEFLERIRAGINTHIGTVPLLFGLYFSLYMHL